MNPFSSILHIFLMVNRIFRIKTAFTNETVSITAPVNTPAGSYIISVQGSIEKPGQNGFWDSTKRDFSVQIGPFSTSQVTVSGTAMVCNGNSYTYTANMPGEHQNGNTYSWTYPSGWSVENTSENTIRLYVPLSYNSYDAVRVSINNGCGTTPLTGITVFPCNYLLTAGSFKVYPNPAQGEINIEYLAEEGISEKLSDSVQRGDDIGSETQVFRVDIFDHAEQVVRSGESKDGKVHLDTQGIRPGSYFLHIYYGKEVVRKQILIQ